MMIQPLRKITSWNGSGLAEDETVAFVERSEAKQLLFPIDSVVSVTSYDGETVYADGRDYVVRDGKLALCENSAIPVMMPELYYSDGDEPILKVRKPDGTVSPCYFGSGGSISRYQVKVTYTHRGTRCILPPGSGRFARLIRLLASGDDVTVFFYGDSITFGADASLTPNLPPFQPSFPILFTCALAERYGRSVRFAQPEAQKAYAGPFPEAPKGGRGTITLVNTAVGGWTSEDGVNRSDTHVAQPVSRYGCDLFVLGFGMNDGGRSGAETAANCETIVRRLLSMQPEASVILISTMLPNPDAIGWNANQASQEPELIRLSEKLNGEGAACGTAKMTTVSAQILKRKRFIDVTGNNINHPNDYLSRVYASALMRTLENAD